MLFGSQLTLPTKFEYYATKPFKGMAYRLVGNDPTDGVQPGTHIKVAHVIGKSHNQYELGGVARFAFGGTGYAQDPQQVFELTFAGFGSYSAKNGRISSVSGRYAGSLQPPRYNSVVNGVGCPAADYWDCATLNYAGAAGTRTVAYGTWSVKYNSAASKCLESNSKYWVK